jgi:hypothetical protein
MAYASRVGRARTSARSPEAQAVCDRCGIWYSRTDLQWQWDWRGAALQNLRILVCRLCLDDPQQQLRAIVLPQDPVPVINARVEQFADDETMTAQGIGSTRGMDPNAVMPLFENTAYGVILNVLSFIADGTTTVSVTTQTPHGLETNGQVAVGGSGSPYSDGFFSVNVTSATAFNYVAPQPIPSGSLLLPNTLIKTALVGLPYGYNQIPL